MATISARAASPMPCSFSAPSVTFSSTVRLSASMKCWKTIPMPWAIASAGVAKVTSVPLTLIVPSSGFCTPYRIFISVDLPAPFSPTSAWMVALRMVMSMSWLAITPGNRLPIPRSSMAWPDAAGAGGSTTVVTVPPDVWTTDARATR